MGANPVGHMPRPIRVIFRRVLISLAVFLAACAGGFLILVLGGPTLHLRGYQQQIDDGTRAIEAATTDRARAAGYVQRGRGYAEIVRYRHVMRSVGAADYARLYRSAMQDLDAAVRLDPDNVDAFKARGLTHFEHSSTAAENGFESKDAIVSMLVRAKNDFTTIIDREGRNEMALDYRGMTNENLGDYTAAIDDYTRVAALDPRLGQLRLADVYCRRGRTWGKQYDKAVADLELSISLEANADACECDPYSPLLWAYFEGLGDLDKSWALVHRAQSNHHWVMPELVEKLKAASSQSR
jgi:tetratricopeptide (TPR) repeat protein